MLVILIHFLKYFNFICFIVFYGCKYQSYQALEKSLKSCVKLCNLSKCDLFNFIAKISEDES